MGNKKQSIAMEFNQHNLDELGRMIQTKNNNLSDKAKDKYAQAVDLLSELMRLKKDRIDMISDGRDETEQDIFDLKLTVSGHRKLELIELITKL
jgi:hypothetical protein